MDIINIDHLDRLIKHSSDRRETDFLKKMRTDLKTFGSLTERKKYAVALTAQRIESRIEKEVAKILPKPPEPEFKSILDEEQRKEIFQFMKDCAYGKHSKDDALKYAQMLADSLTERGVKVELFKEQDKNGNWID